MSCINFEYPSTYAMEKHAFTTIVKRRLYLLPLDIDQNYLVWSERRSVSD